MISAKKITILGMIAASTTLLAACGGSNSMDGESMAFTTQSVTDVNTYDCAAQSRVTELECLALKSLYIDTGGDNWTDNTNWWLDVDMNDWYGLSLNNGRVSSISLHKNNLVGTIPGDIGNMSKLFRLSLYDNFLTGPIPESIGALDKLVYLYLYDNTLNGGIPDSIGQMSFVEHIYLSNNELTGEIPSSIGNLNNLTELKLYMNDLSGEIPSELGQLSNLNALNLFDNNLCSTIPETFTNLTSLIGLSIRDNNLITDSSLYGAEIYQWILDNGGFGNQASNDCTLEVGQEEEVLEEEENSDNEGRVIGGDRQGFEKTRNSEEKITQGSNEIIHKELSQKMEREVMKKESTGITREGTREIEVFKR